MNFKDERIETAQKSVKSSGENFLLLIGIDKYQYVGHLQNAVRDAKAFREILLAKYNFKEDHVIELFNQRATYDAIDRILRKLALDLRPQDNLIIYFSGHGHYDEFYGDGYWIPVDARYENTMGYFSYNNIVAAIRRIPAQHTFLIVDSCYSGAILVQDTRASIPRDPREDDPSRWILASGRNEVVPDGEAGGNSPFSEQLLDVLDRYADKGIAVLSLVDKVTTATIHNGKQKPIGRPLYNAGDKGGQFIFHPKGMMQTAHIETSFQQTQREENHNTQYTDSAKHSSLLSRLQKHPSWVWIIVPAILIPGLYWGISQLGKQGPDVDSRANHVQDSVGMQNILDLQEELSGSDSTSFNEENHLNSTEDTFLLSGESGLEKLHNLNDSTWARMQNMLKLLGFTLPKMKKLLGDSRFMSEGLISQQEYYLFLFTLNEIGYSTEGWTDHFIKIDNSLRKFQGSDLALMNVSWYGAKAYCYWLSKVSGQNYRLPESHEINPPLLRMVEWCGNGEPGERGYFPDSKKPDIDKSRKPFLSRDIGFRIVRE